MSFCSLLCVISSVFVYFCCCLPCHLSPLVQADYLSGKSVFEQSSLEAAISGVIFEIIEPEQTVSGAADNAIINHFRQLGPAYSR